MKSTFCFLDESGTLSINNPLVRYFALGAIIHADPDDLILNLHKEFSALCSTLGRDRTGLEFKFSRVTPRSLPHYKNCLRILANDGGWRFCSFVVDLDDPKFKAPRNHIQAWQLYFKFIKLLLEKIFDRMKKLLL